MIISPTLPWWAIHARLIGWWRRWRKERADRAEAIRKHHAQVWVGRLTGKTHWQDRGYDQITHEWEFFESPAGVRRVEFRAIVDFTCKKDGRDHPLYEIISQWLNHRYDIDWNTTRKTGKVAGWRRETVK